VQRSRIAITLAALLLALSNAVCAAEPAPPGAGVTKADTNYRVGDRYSYRTMDLFSKVESGQHTLRVTDVKDDQVTFNGGRRVTDRLGNDIAAGNGNQFSGQQIFVPEYSVGKKWTTRFRFVRADGAEFDVTYDFEVAAKEQITVPAGTFDTYRVEGGGYMRQMSGRRAKACERNSIFKIWIAPDQVRRYIAQDYVQKGAALGCGYFVVTRTELLSYRQGERLAGIERPDPPGSADYVPGHATVPEPPHSDSGG
jgi:hypothetical protein